MAKKNKTKVKDPQVTLVGTFRGHNVFITGNQAIAKDYADVFGLGLSSIGILQSMKDEQEQILLNKLPKKNGKSTRKTKKS